MSPRCLQFCHAMAFWVQGTLVSIQGLSAHDDTARPLKPEGDQPRASLNSEAIALSHAGDGTLGRPSCRKAS